MKTIRKVVTGKQSHIEFKQFVNLFTKSNILDSVFLWEQRFFYTSRWIFCSNLRFTTATQIWKQDQHPQIFCKTSFVGAISFYLTTRSDHLSYFNSVQHSRREYRSSMVFKRWRDPLRYHPYGFILGQLHRWSSIYESHVSSFALIYLLCRSFEIYDPDAAHSP